MWTRMPLFPSKSTAVSDLVLGSSCIWALYSLYGGSPAVNLKTRITTDGGMASNNLASVWFALTLAASILGAVRFCKSTFLFYSRVNINNIKICVCSEKGILWSFGSDSRFVILVGACYWTPVSSVPVLLECRPSSSGQPSPIAHIAANSFLVGQRSVITNIF